MDISDVFLIMKLSNWCLMATYKHINIILGTVLCTLCRVFVIVRTPYRAWLENGDSDTP
jgi:hypothetical protein